jgi:hypothetical protein
MDWSFFAFLAGGIGILLWRNRNEAMQRDERGDAMGLAPARDLTHLPEGLAASALWRLSDGGFERRLLRGTISRGPADVEVTSFDLETLRERRGEWAFLPVEQPFRIRGVVTVVVCELPGPLPHLVLKRQGRGDELNPDDWLERETSMTKGTRTLLGLPMQHAAELPEGLATVARPVSGAPDWRAYVGDEVLFQELLRGGLGEVLGKLELRDLVLEVVGHLLVAYPATRDALGLAGFRELCAAAASAAVVVRRVLAGRSPRGEEPGAGREPTGA